MLESKFQGDLIKEIKKRFPGAFVMKNDSSYIQGVPDLTVFYEDKWAVLECKKNRTAKHQPNQDRYVEQLDSMSFSRFIFPENKDQVLEELGLYFLNKRRKRR